MVYVSTLARKGTPRPGQLVHLQRLLNVPGSHSSPGQYHCARIALLTNPSSPCFGVSVSIVHHNTLLILNKLRGNLHAFVSCLECILVYPFILQALHDLPIERRFACTGAAAEQDKFHIVTLCERLFGHDGFSGSSKKNSSGVMKGMPMFTAKSLSEQEWSFLTPFFLSPSRPAASPTNSVLSCLSIIVKPLELGRHRLMPPFPIIRSFSKAVSRLCGNQCVVEIKSRNFDGLVALKLVGVTMARYKHRVLYDVEFHGVRLPLLLRYGLEKFRRGGEKGLCPECDAEETPRDST
ncbi:hypothetical protein KC326_g150 [Hortaea werneckii]|nr:hypothetical protein KC326_g150 [Hortaea werneckii]